MFRSILMVFFVFSFAVTKVSAGGFVLETTKISPEEVSQAEQQLKSQEVPGSIIGNWARNEWEQIKQAANDPVIQAQRAEKPVDSSYNSLSLRDYSCKVYCLEPSGITNVVIKADNSSNAAKIVSDQSKRVCQDAGYGLDHPSDMRSNQCQLK